MKRKVLILTSLTLGLLASFGIIGWITLLDGLPESLLRPDRLQILVFLLLAPVTLLPAGVLANDRPLAAGIWKLGAGLASAAWLMLIIHGGKVEDLGFWNAGLPLVSCSLSSGLLGSALLFAAEGEQPARGPRSRWPLVWANMHVLVTAILIVAAAVAAHRQSDRMRWMLTVTPAGGPSTIATVDARSHQIEVEKSFSEALDPLFSESSMARDGVLGRYELEGRTFAGKVHWIYDCTVESEVKRVTIHRADHPKDTYIVECETLWNARLMSVRNLQHSVSASRYEDPQ